jgi:hypothetical protein
VSQLSEKAAFGRERPVVGGLIVQPLLALPVVCPPNHNSLPPSPSIPPTMSPIATDNQTINQATPASKAELVQLNQEGAVSTSALVSSSTSLTKGDYSKFLRCVHFCRPVFIITLLIASCFARPASEESAARNPSPLKHLAVKYLVRPTFLRACAGPPSPDAFDYSSCRVSADSGPFFHLAEHSGHNQLR